MGGVLPVRLGVGGPFRRLWGRMTHKEQLLKGARDAVWWCTCGAQGLIPQHDKSK